jgi:hypothetical protein
MRILIINADYAPFLKWFYGKNPDVADKSYEDQIKARHQSMFGLAGHYSTNFRRLGHEAWDVRANDEIMQTRWASEEGCSVASQSSARKRSRKILEALRPVAAKLPLRHLKPVLRPMAKRVSGNWMYGVLEAQIRHYKPDVILNQAVEIISDDFLMTMKPNVRLIVGQIAAPLPEQQKYSSYDLVISSLPNYVDYFRRNGVASDLSRLAFEPSILTTVGPGSLRFGATFVGSMSSFHANRIELLEGLCESVNLDVWGEVFGSLPRRSSIKNRHHGSAWGADMFRILRDSRITINHHIGIAENYANNMRLYEATGVGALLLTDAKKNLSEIFKIDKEVVSYSTPAECKEKILYYLSHDKERDEIARAGQRRTLTEHTYARRAEELLHLIDARLHDRPSHILQGSR